MSMNQNDDIRYLDIGLPEDIARLKAVGDIDNALRLIDMHLADPNTTAPLAACMRVQREIMLRLPRNYPYTFETAMACIRKDIPDFTEDEFHALEDMNKIGWIFINGERRYFKRFHQTLLKVNADYAARANIKDTGTSQGEDKPTEAVSMLDRSMNIMRERGSFGVHLRIRASIRINDDAFVPGKVVKVHLPIPAKCIQQSNIKLIAFSHEPKHICPEDAPIRTVYFEEKLYENTEFFVEYEYDNIAPYCDTYKLIPDAEQPNDFDTQEQSPHIVFTPYIRELVKELGAGCANNLEKARNFYDFVTTRVTYSFMPEYFCLESIAEGCARNLKGDCGVQALLFITLCRCAQNGRAASTPLPAISATMTGRSSTLPPTAGCLQIPPLAAARTASIIPPAASTISAISIRTEWLPTANSSTRSTPRKPSGATTPMITRAARLNTTMRRYPQAA